MTRTLSETDFDQFLQEVGLTHAQVEGAPIDVLPVRNDSITIAESPIHGVGAFAEKNFGKGENIGESYIGGKWTPLGRYANHALFPNCRMRRDGRNMCVVAAEAIPLGAELTLNYRQVKQTVENLNQPSP